MFGKNDVIPGRRLTLGITLTFVSLFLFIPLAAGIINAVFGLIIAWVLVRYDFRGKKIMDALIDLPFALSS